jgi:hypothetical protein
MMNLVRRIDEAAIRRSASTPERVADAMEIMLRNYFRASEERPLSPWQEVTDAWQQKGVRREHIVLKWLSTLGITSAKNPVSAPLHQAVIDEIVSLPVDRLATRFGIVQPMRG